tara:strand:- start:136 stop:396 length:261 start_codon:yes stop_codon:yes gene_type:complete
MAEWQHKEEEWCDKELHWEHNTAYSGWVIRDGTLQLIQFVDFESEEMVDFPGWLDYHCDGGWEVLKISRDFHSQVSKTWCIFRRLI